ncbi:hypothetical protein SNE40_009569 [Patella caerulea]|uniref:Uncharacterized protein n=1 Tax=Patella caerulea TaxID=87958 RepID=A0AAN8PRZ3_PATCE
MESDINKCPVRVPDDERPSTPEIDRDDEVRDPDHVPDEDGTDSDSQTGTEPKRKMRPQNWSRESNKRLRMEGRAYKGMKKLTNILLLVLRKIAGKCKEESVLKHVIKETENVVILQMMIDRKYLQVSGKTWIGRKRKSS